MSKAKPSKSYGAFARMTPSIDEDFIDLTPESEGVYFRIVRMMEARGALWDRQASVLFGERDVPVSSIKALTGHMMGAAGAVEAVASLLALRHAAIPPTWNWQEADPDCDIDCVPNEPRPARLRHILSNSYAFGGNNASLVLSVPGAGRR